MLTVQVPPEEQKPDHDGYFNGYFTPSQFYEALHGTARLFCPEQRLALAILEDAVDVFQTHAISLDPRSRWSFTKAAEWLASTDATWIFSFESICEMFNIEPAYIRRGLRMWLAQQLRDKPMLAHMLRRRGDADEWLS